MKTLRIAICDDKKNMLDVMSGAVKRAFLRNGINAETETFYSSDSLYRAMVKRGFDLIFLDIQMPHTDGIAFGERLRREGDKTDIIYVSAREDRVFDTFKTNPVDFVRKSNFVDDLTRVIDNYLIKLDEKKGDTVAISSKSGIMNLSVSQIIYFEGSGKSQLVHIDGIKDCVTVYKSMELLEEEFKEKGFIRIHKGLLVNYKYISRILVGDAELTNGEVLPISRRRATAIKTEYLALLKNGGSLII